MEKITDSQAEVELGRPEQTSLLRQRSTTRRQNWRLRAVALALGLSYLAFRGIPYTLDRRPGLKGIQSGIIGDNGCPVQPEPLHPRLTWDMSDEDQVRTTDHFSQAVVSLPLSVDPVIQDRKGPMREC